MAMAFSTSEALQPLVLRSHSDEETRTIGRRIGAGLRPGDCLALKGEMGAGKTVTAQGIVQGAGGGADVRSPTFLLHAIYAGRSPSTTSISTALVPASTCACSGWMKLCWRAR